MLKKTCLYLMAIAGFLYSGTITDELLEYSITLPDNWVREAVSSNHHRFYDTTQVFKSYVALIRYDLSENETVNNAHEWARANYLAYLISVQCTMSPQGETLADPFGIPLYYDSSTVKQNDSLWAAEIFSTFFTTDTTLGSWSEFIRYTGKGNFGYEFYAIGDTADMNTNLGMYAAIIDLINIETSLVSVIPVVKKTDLDRTGSIKPFSPSDLLGRRVMKGDCLKTSSRILVDSRRKTIFMYNR
jgi:hypothetical protein